MQWTIAGTTVDGLRDSPTPTWTWGEETSLRFKFEESDVETRYHALLEYVRDAGLATTTVYNTRGRARYEERLPAAATVSSLVVALEPGSDVIDVDGVWALVTGGRDESRPVTGTRELSLRVVPLALRGTYADRQAVEDALGTGVV